MTASGEVASFVSAAESFAQLVRQIPSDRWDGPGMGAWNLRSLPEGVDAVVSLCRVGNADLSARTEQIDVRLIDRRASTTTLTLCCSTPCAWSSSCAAMAGPC
jgi:hypothetical protein